MNQRQRDLCNYLRKQTSEEAFIWLTSEFPPDNGDAIGEALILMPHRSWKRSEQVKLFDAYFPRSFPMGKKSIEVFSKFMSIYLFTTMLKSFIEQYPEEDETKLSLADYRLRAFIMESEDHQYEKEFKGVLDLINTKRSALQSGSLSIAKRL